MIKPLGGSSQSHGSRQRRQHERGVQRRTQRPTDHWSRIQIDEDGQIQPAAPNTQSTLESVSLHWSTLATLPRRTHVRFSGGGRRWRLSSPEKRLRTEDTDGDPRPHRKESVKLVKITEIKVYPTWVGGRNQLIVKVETDEGIHGWGEAGVSGRELAVKGAVEHYREFLLGRDPRRPGALWQEMYRSQYFEGGRVLTGAISAIERWGSGGALRLDIANALGLERITELEQRYATAG